MSRKDAIAAFWTWWAEGRHQIEQSIESGQWGQLPDLITQHVHAIDPQLEWELGKGQDAQHHLCLTAKGNAELRVVTEQWLAAGPGSDQTWEYYPARQARRGTRLEVDGMAFDHDTMQVAFESDTTKERVHVAVHHPHFEKLPENARGMITFLMLDGWFGEDGVERWIGRVECPEQAPEGLQSWQTMSDAVDELKAQATGQQWVLLRGQDARDWPIFVMCNQALKRVDHLLKVVHIAVDVEILEPTDEGLVGGDEAQELNELEDALLGQVGELTVHIGRETRRGRRVLHFQSAESSSAMAHIDAWVKRQTGRDIQVHTHMDPQWQRVSPWL